MTFVRQSGIKGEDRSYYANYNYIKDKIFEYSNDLKESYAEYYNIKVNKRMASPRKLDRLRTALRRLFDEIRPKLETSGTEDDKNMVKEINNYEAFLIPIPFEKIVLYKNRLIDWVEKSGLSKIDIEQQNLLDQVESECYE